MIHSTIAQFCLGYWGSIFTKNRTFTITPLTYDKRKSTIMVLFTKAIVRSKRCRTSNKIVNAYESLVTETAHAHYALREETKVADVNMDGGSRKPNWSEVEISLLVEQVEQKKDILKGKFSPSLSATDKTEAWSYITDRYRII